MVRNEAIVKGDNTLRVILNDDNVNVTVAFREGQLPAGPGLQSHSIDVTVADLVGLLEELGFQVTAPQGA